MDTETKTNDTFDLATLVAQDEAEFVVKHPKTQKPTTWVWTFYGPGHPRSVEVTNRVVREALEENAAKEQARINGKKWKEEAKDLEKLRADNVANIVARTKSFTPVKLGDDVIHFTPDAATKILLDRKMSWLIVDITEFLQATENFIQASATS